MAGLGSPTPEDFRQLMIEIFVDGLVVESLHTLVWTLQLPCKLLDAKAPSISMAILRSLEDRGILFEWSKDPKILIDVLTKTLNREDLAARVKEWSDQQFPREKPVIPQQETSQCDEVTPTTKKMPKARPTRKLSLRRKDTLESLKEQSDEEKETITDSSWEKRDALEIHRRNMQRRRAGIPTEQADSRIVSVASSGYFTDSQRFSGLSLSDTWKNVELPDFTDSNPFADETQGPRNSESDTDQPGYRPRSKSLGNAKTARIQVNNKLHKGTTTSSSSSLKSETSELTSWSSVSSQRSISSEEQNTTDQDSNGGSAQGTLETAKTGSLRRAHTTSSICITGQISIPLRKVKEDIAEGKNSPRTSDPFPCSKDIQFMLRFFSLNFANTGCALYLDVAPKYLKKQVKRPKAKAIKVPDMEVTVDVNVCSSSTSKQKIATSFERVESKIMDLQKQHSKDFVVCSFPNLITFEKLKPHFDDTNNVLSLSDLVVEVYLKCV